MHGLQAHTVKDLHNCGRKNIDLVKYQRRILIGNHILVQCIFWGKFREFLLEESSYLEPSPRGRCPTLQDVPTWFLPPTMGLAACEALYRVHITPSPLPPPLCTRRWVLPQNKHRESRAGRAKSTVRLFRNNPK